MTTQRGVEMATRVRTCSVVCLLVSLERLLLGRLGYSRDYIGTTIKMEDGGEYQVFRHVTSLPQRNNERGPVLIVRFKFKRLSHAANVFVSQFPMLLITGFPGFRTKMYAVNTKNGYWLGMYQWECKEALERYRASFVLRVMNRRAVDGSVTYREFDEQRLTDYIEKHKIDRIQLRP
jgi:hypothetical protein